LPDAKGLGSGRGFVTNDAGHGGSELGPSLRRLALAIRRKQEGTAVVRCLSVLTN